jgi:hypothetical protein
MGGFVGGGRGAGMPACLLVMVKIIHFFIIYVLAQESQGKLQRWHNYRESTKVQATNANKSTSNKCKHIRRVIKIASDNNIIILEEKFVEWTVF